MADELYARDGEWQTLEEALRSYTVGGLKTLATALPGRGPGGVKEERIARLCQRMTGESLRDHWHKLGLVEPKEMGRATFDTRDSSSVPAAPARASAPTIEP